MCCSLLFVVFLKSQEGPVGVLDVLLTFINRLSCCHRVRKRQMAVTHHEAT